MAGLVHICESKHLKPKGLPRGKPKAGTWGSRRRSSKSDPQDVLGRGLGSPDSDSDSGVGSPGSGVNSTGSSCDSSGSGAGSFGSPGYSGSGDGFSGSGYSGSCVDLGSFDVDGGSFDVDGGAFDVDRGASGSCLDLGTGSCPESGLGESGSSGNGGDEAGPSSSGASALDDSIIEIIEIEHSEDRSEVIYYSLKRIEQQARLALVSSSSI